jgi:hypothetical protein
MLHALPALLEELEQRLMAGRDPLPLLNAVQWPDLVGWPQTAEEAAALKLRVTRVQGLIAGLQAPLRATLSALRVEPAYTLKGLRPDAPMSLGTLPDII